MTANIDYQAIGNSVVGHEFDDSVDKLNDIDYNSEYRKSISINELEQQIKLMRQYLIHKFEINDYHGVWDSAIDLQRLTDKLQILRG